MTTIKCEQCGKEFAAQTKRRRFCDECRVERGREQARRYAFYGKDRTEYQRQYYAAHREKLAERQRQWRAAHPDYGRQWRAAHPDYGRQWRARRKEEHSRA